MDRIHVHPRGTLGAYLGRFLRALNDHRRAQVEAARLDTLPRERLLDIGIVPRTEDNLRHSGQTGSLIHPQLW